MVLTNPPFGKKSSVTFVTDEGEIKREAQNIVREDFWTSTSNKQLNFVQHILTVLKPGGRAAVVLPDNCLFADQAGEGQRQDQGSQAAQVNRLGGSNRNFGRWTLFHYDQYCSRFSPGCGSFWPAAC